MSDVTYVQQFAWTCPDCGLTNYLDHRPRRRRAVVCGAHDLAHLTPHGCGVVHTISGLENK